MIKLSFAEIERRVRSLEGALASLEERVERLEARQAS